MALQLMSNNISVTGTAGGNIRVALAAILVLLSQALVQASSLSSVDSQQLSPSTAAASSAASRQAARDSFLYSDSFDRLNGEQFVELLDPLMEGQLSRIIEQIKHKYPAHILARLSSAPQLPARQFLSIIDYLSGGEVSAALRTSFPNFYLPLADRPRRASLDTMSGLSLGYAKKSLDAMSGLSFGAPSKRAVGGNFDEMDRTGFSGFAKRRSDFDEIDRAGFSGFAKRRSDFDEIDRAGFSGFAKRRSDFDEIDRSGFSGFAKRRSDFDEIDRAGFSGFAKRFNFDELDRNGFTGFMQKRAAVQMSGRMNPVAAMMQSKSNKQHQKEEKTQQGSQPEKAVPVEQAKRLIKM